jgi:pantoate--beta-alanine ligase
MQILETIAQMTSWRKNRPTIAFVPTMGNLHAGHLALIQKAKTLADCVVASIFVNPLQFGPKEDFATYPKTEAADIEKLEQLNVDALFLPKVNEIYPHGSESLTKITVAGLSDDLCGKSRPGHFAGVATVVAKLFNIVQPHIAIFGEKDYQQLTVIRQMVADLNFPIQIISAPTEREPDGLAMSSRNQYLTTEERKIAPQLYATLHWIKAQITSGNTDYASLIGAAATQLNGHGTPCPYFKIDYVAIRAQNTLALPSLGDANLVILCAAFLRKTRLIDNLIFSR